jgi:hypothetical protein
MNELNWYKDLNIEYITRPQESLENYPKITPNQPGSFTGFEFFFQRSLPERGVEVQEDKKLVRDWMRVNSTFSKHRYARRRFP